MRESVTYQAILEEGFEKGIEKGIERGVEKGIVTEARSMFLRSGIRKLGVPSVASREMIELISDRESFEMLNDRLVDGGCTTWDQLLNVLA